MRGQDQISTGDHEDVAFPQNLGGDFRSAVWPRGAPEEQVGALVDLDSVTFSGVLYKRNRSGSLSRKEVELDVDVTKMSSVAFGDRLDFVVVAESD